jgi:primosomal protein N' (replication factor Y) (superfamily II helicase)
MESLFAEVPEATMAEKPAGPFAAVAIEKSLDRMLDYAIPPKLVGEVRVGQRVRVPLGRNNHPTTGYVIAIKPESDYPRIKKIIAVEDARVLIDPKLMALARWMSRYYVTPLGTVLDSVIPSAVKKKVGSGYSQIVRLAKSREEIQELFEKTKAPKRRAVIARLLLLEGDRGIDIVRLAGEAGVKVPTVRKLLRMGVITVTAEMDLSGDLKHAGPLNGDGEADRILNEDQQNVFDALRPKMAGGFSVNLLHGVTGSGKTEIYLQCIRDVVAQGKQAIVLVPEIALTPQTQRRFFARFSRVAVLHSGLTATDRHRYWRMIAAGRADVIVGARSAIFAPARNLGIIVVDEEHEASYKQDTAPRYHGRDVAVKRAQMEGVPVILGSATPSLETYVRVGGLGARGSGFGEEQKNPGSNGLAESRAQSPEPYSLFALPRRVRGLEMPHVEIVDMKNQVKSRRGVHLISERLEHLLKATLQAGHQAILLLNRRGYSNFVYCASCGDVIQCKYCDATMTYHRMAGAHSTSASNAASVHTGQLHCHYCLAVNPLPNKCPTCGKLLSLFGLGTQRVEEELSRKFPELKFVRVDSDSMRNSKDYEATLAKFASGEIQVLLGTQMIAKGLDYPNVTLVGVISGDTALSLPDFRASERTFQLITQVAGRAGRGDAPGRVVLQTFVPDDPTIQAAIKQDFVRFAKNELVHREEVMLPPFARMVRVILRDQEEEKLHALCDQIAEKFAAAVEKVGGGEVKMKGPMPCAISRIAGYFRNQIVLVSRKGSLLQKVLFEVREAGDLAKSDRIAVDVDPVSLL